MITTALFSPLVGTVLHRVSGSVDLREAKRGAAEALQFVQEVAVAEGPLSLVLDLRGAHFVTLQAHKAWSQGFARHPKMQGFVRAVAIVGDDTSAFRSEQALLETTRVRFFTDPLSAAAWLGRAPGDPG